MLNVDIITGGWWYGPCQSSSVNGVYSQTGNYNESAGIYWKSPSTNKVKVIKWMEIKLRPADYKIP